MGLYLCIFATPQSDEELEGVDVGSYADFDSLRRLVAAELEEGAWARRFPVLMNQPDTGPEWSASQARILVRELSAIRAELQQRPPQPPADGTWQAEVVSSSGLRPDTLADCLIDVDGEPLLDRLIELAVLAGERDLPITFQ